MTSRRYSRDQKLIENFENMMFCSEPRVADDSSRLKIVVESPNVIAIAIFLFCVVLAITFVAYWLEADREYIALAFAGGLATGGMFVGAMQLIAISTRNQIHPYVDKDSDSLVLASGTIIPRQEIRRFRQYQCKTRTSNFKLVLTTLESLGSHGVCEYAVIPVIGKIAGDRVGLAFATYFDVQIVQDATCRATSQDLRWFGVA